MNVNFGGGNVPDLSARFIMQVDDGGLADEDAPKDTGGFRWHGADGPGEADNNHPDHVWDTQQADDNLDFIVTEIMVSDDWPDAEEHAEHLGPFNALKDTDNRPRYYVSAARIRNA